MRVDGDLGELPGIFSTALLDDLHRDRQPLQIALKLVVRNPAIGLVVRKAKMLRHFEQGGLPTTRNPYAVPDSAEQENGKQQDRKNFGWIHKLKPIVSRQAIEQGISLRVETFKSSSRRQTP